MKNQLFHAIPVPLQHQILIRSALAALSLLLSIPLLLLGAGLTAAIPFLLITILLAVNAGHIYYIAVTNRFLALNGVVLKLELAAFRRRPKALLLEVEGKALRVMLRNRHKAPKAGDRITLFITEDTQLYPWRGLHQLSGYLTLTSCHTATGA